MVKLVCPCFLFFLSGASESFLRRSFSFSTIDSAILLSAVAYSISVATVTSSALVDRKHIAAHGAVQEYFHRDLRQTPVSFYLAQILYNMNLFGDVQ